MALTFTHIAPSSEINPVYGSPFAYRLTSSLSSSIEFRYVFDLYLLNQVTDAEQQFVGRFKIPLESDGSGIYSPAEVLRNYVSFNHVFFGSGFTTNTNSTCKFKFYSGEEYRLTGMTFTSITNSGGFCQYNFTNAITNFQAGDKIKIEKYLKNVNREYDGLQTVTLVSSNNLQTDKPFGIATTNESGECVYRLSISTSSATTMSGVCFNGVRNYMDASKSFANTHYANDGDRLFLSTLDSETINIGMNDIYSLSFLQNPTLSSVTDAVIFTYSGSVSPSNAIGVYSIPCSATPYRHLSLKVGTRNLAETVLTNIATSNLEPVYSSLVKSYVVTLVSGVDQAMQLKTFIVNDEPCQYKYNQIQLVWLNELGGWSYQSFNMKRKRKTEIKREYVTRVLPFNYQVGNQTEFVLGSRVDEVISLNTSYLNEPEALELESLFNSSNIYIIEDDMTLPFVPISKEYVEKTVDNDGLISYTFEGRYGFPKHLQSN